MTEPNEQSYKCADCGAPMNEGEAKTFTVCDTCFDKNYKKRMGPPENEQSPEAMTIEQAKAVVAKKYGLGSTLVTGHKATYWEEAIALQNASLRQQLAEHKKLIEELTWEVEVLAGLGSQKEHDRLQSIIARAKALIN